MISVIVPVFNTKEYLKRCLDSILSQTFRDFELIIMDDGSTDGSGEICDEYTEKDKRVRAIHQKNEGLAKTRTTAVSIAKGDYVSFVDSDDWIESDYLEKMYLPIDINSEIQIDVVAGLHKKEQNGKSTLVKRTVKEGLYDKNEIYWKILPRFFRDYKQRIPGVSASLCTKLLRRELLQGVQEGLDTRITCGEDGSVTFPMFIRAENVVVTDYCGYHYCYRENSMTSELSSDIFSRIDVLKEYLQRVLENYGYEKWLSDQVDAYTNVFLPVAIAQKYKFNIPMLRSDLDLDFIPEGSRVILYGAGKRGARWYREICIQKRAEIVACVDKAEPRWPVQMEVERPEVIKDKLFDYILITVSDKSMALEIRERILELGIDSKRILWQGKLRTKGYELFHLTKDHWRVINKYKRVCIYGAGEYGKGLFDKLSKANVPIDCFIVTEKSMDFEYCRGIKVTGFNDWLRNDESLIIVAAARKTRLEIIKVLESEGIYNYLSILPILPSEMEEIWGDTPIKENKVFFDAFRGLGYTCNPKYVAEALRKQNSEIDMVWDVTDDANMAFPEYIRTVHRDEAEFYREYYTSRFVVTNMNSVMGPYKRKGQYFINTWHGTGPFKKVGKYVYELNNNAGDSKTMIREYENVDIATAACDQCIHNHRIAFEYKGRIEKWGYPRNDVFFKDSKPLIKKVYTYFGIEETKRIVLFAPTFRYSLRTGKKMMEEVYDLNLAKVKRAMGDKFGGEFVILYRFHQYLYRSRDVYGYYSYGIDATMYPDMQELLVAADVLITDWSSSIWDYALTKKPIFLFYHDAADAEKESGFYVHPDDLPFPKGHSTEELITRIDGFDNNSYIENLETFINHYHSYDDGHSSERIADHIVQLMTGDGEI